ncbi:uncharacterized protein LOC123899325 [Trifolium pratense]|uniref:uncharacterized protein LOC123899325 n=1 Tax=Trifolium pratense TaxID=57577 RepID=UPI001E695472|nr:uncharacterized protein LOC123899325 [Trifolium pratense]
MEEHPERAELRRIQREQERERRRIRDRQRRQAMTQEQRERHLARRRRNYQLRRQRAANANNVNAPFIPLPLNPLALESSAGEASTSDEFQGVNSLTSLDYRVLSHGIGFPHHGLNQGQGTMNLGTEVSHEGSSMNMETLDLKLDNSPRMRLSRIKNLARNNVASAELKTKEDREVGDFGSTPKSLRLNSVKRIARSQSMNSAPKETDIHQKDDDLPPEEGIQLLDNQSFMATS